MSSCPLRAGLVKNDKVLWHFEMIPLLPAESKGFFLDLLWESGQVPGEKPHNIMSFPVSGGSSQSCHGASSN